MHKKKAISQNISPHFGFAIHSLHILRKFDIPSCSCCADFREYDLNFYGMYILHTGSSEPGDDFGS